MVNKPKYLDAARYPKVMTNGYEKDFKNNYVITIQEMTKKIAKQMFNLNNKK